MPRVPPPISSERVFTFIRSVAGCVSFKNEPNERRHWFPDESAGYVRNLYGDKTDRSAGSGDSERYDHVGSEDGSPL